MASNVPMLPLVAGLLGVVASGCGGDETTPLTSVGGSGGDGGGGGGGGGGGSPAAGAVLPCPPGELPLDDGGCLPPGIPSDGCGSGFTHDGDRGCEPVLPAEPCGAGELAVPGDTACRPVSVCAGGTWGVIPTDGTTEHVDGSYQGISTGTASQPWTTVQEGIDAAAPDAIVALASSTYGEAVVIGQSVTLWGACPAEVTLTGPANGAALTVQDGAATVILRDLAITGQAVGILASGSDDLLVERVWIHDTGGTGIVAQPGSNPTSIVVRDSLIDQATSRGMSLHGGSGLVERSLVRHTVHHDSSDAGLAVHADSGGDGELTLRQTVVEGSAGLGLLTQAATLVIEDSVVRDTLPRLNGTDGVAVWARAAELQRATVTVQGSLIETSYSYGIRADDSNVAVERTVIRDILPQQSNQTDGMGLRTYGLDPGLSPRPQCRVEQTLVERVQDVGLQGSGVEMVVTATVVRDVAPRASDLIRGRGINLRYAAGNTEARSTGTIRGCLVERTHEAGILVVGSDVDIDSCAVIDVQSRPSDGLLGFGVLFARNIPMVEEGAAGTLVRSLIQEAHGGGVVAVGSELEVTDVIVRDTLRQVEADDFGDGIAESSSLLLAPGYFPTRIDITRATVERSARAALATFAAPMTVADSLIDCNLIDMNGEMEGDETFAVQDAGGNQCGCAAEGDHHLCRVLSSGLRPPMVH